MRLRRMVHGWAGRENADRPRPWGRVMRRLVIPIEAEGEAEGEVEVIVDG